MVMSSGDITASVCVSDSVTVVQYSWKSLDA